MTKEQTIAEVFQKLEPFSDLLKPLYTLIEDSDEKTACRKKYNNFQKGETAEISALVLFILHHLDTIKGSLNEEQLFKLINFFSLAANYCIQQSVSKEDVALKEANTRLRINASLLCLLSTSLDLNRLLSHESNATNRIIYLRDECGLNDEQIEILAQFFLYYGKYSRFSDINHELLPEDDLQRLIFLGIANELAKHINHQVIESTAIASTYFVYTDLKAFDDARRLMQGAYERSLEKNRRYDQAIYGSRLVMAILKDFNDTRNITLLDRAKALLNSLDFVVNETEPTDNEILLNRLPFYIVKIEQLRMLMVQYSYLKNTNPDDANQSFQAAHQLWDQHFSIYSESGEKKDSAKDKDIRNGDILNAIKIFEQYGCALTEDMANHKKRVSKPPAKKNITDKWSRFAKTINTMSKLASTKKGNGPSKAVWLEELDPSSRPYPKLNSLREKWIDNGDASEICFFESIKDEKLSEVVHSKIEGKKHEICFQDGLAYKVFDLNLLKKHDYQDKSPALLHTMLLPGKPKKPKTNGYAVFVLSAENKKLYCMPYQRDKLHHTTCTDGGRTLSAGMMKVNDGCILGLQMMSGHYKPYGRELMNILTFLHQNGVDISSREGASRDSIPFVESEFMQKEFIDEMIEAIQAGEQEAFINRCQYIPPSSVWEEAMRSTFLTPFNLKPSPQTPNTSKRYTGSEFTSTDTSDREKLIRLHVMTGIPIADLLSSISPDDDNLEVIQNHFETYFNEANKLFNDLEFGRIYVTTNPDYRNFVSLYNNVFERFGSFIFDTPNNLQIELKHAVVYAYAISQFNKAYQPNNTPSI